MSRTKAKKLTPKKAAIKKLLSKVIATEPQEPDIAERRHNQMMMATQEAAVALREGTKLNIEAMEQFFGKLIETIQVGAEASTNNQIHGINRTELQLNALNSSVANNLTTGITSTLRWHGGTMQGVITKAGEKIANSIHSLNSMVFWLFVIEALQLLAFLAVAAKYFK